MRRDDERGFSLIETLAAITVFAIVTVGITPLLVSSVRGSALSRSLTVGKNVAQEAMERLRGLPYFDTAAGRDVLDLYFPNLVSSGIAGYNAASRTFTTICTATTDSPASSGAKACPPVREDGVSRVPPGYTVTFVATFVTPSGTGAETFQLATIPANYDSAAAATATPPSLLLNMTITVSWTQLGRTRSFRLTSLIGDRKLSPDKAKATATVDFTVQAQTSYGVQLPERLSSLTAIAGRSVADAEIRSFASASTHNSAARMELLRQEYDDLLNAPVPGETLDTAVGAEATVRAPNTPTEVSGNPNQRIDHPDLIPQTTAEVVDQTKVNGTTVITPVVQVVNNLPLARGGFSFVGSQESWWVNNQFDPNTNTSELSLDPLRHIFSLFAVGSLRTRGNTYAEATEVGTASRKVEATAHAEVPRAELLVSTATSSNSDASGDRGVVVIRNFVADVGCKATGTLATSSVTGSWSATLKYWKDATNTPLGVANGAYVTQQIGGSLNSGVDPLATIRAENPLVLDHPTSNADDVYLFQIPDPVDENLPPLQKGFLTSWSSTPQLSSAKTELTEGGIEARVSMPFALNIVTSFTDPDNPETRLTINFGKLSCRAVDKR